MTTRTYIRTYVAEQTETFTVDDADLTAEELAVLDDFDRGFTDSLHVDVADILDKFDADHVDVSITDDQSVTVERAA